MDLTKRELIQFGKEQGIRLSNAKTKAELVRTLKNRLEVDEDELKQKVEWKIELWHRPESAIDFVDDGRRWSERDDMGISAGAGRVYATLPVKPAFLSPDGVPYFQVIHKWTLFPEDVAPGLWYGSLVDKNRIKWKNGGKELSTRLRIDKNPEHHYRSIRHSISNVYEWGPIDANDIGPSGLPDVLCALVADYAKIEHLAEFECYVRGGWSGIKRKRPSL